MQFKNKVQEETYKKVEQWLPVTVGEDRMGKHGDDGFWVSEGSTFVYVRVIEWAKDDAIVRCSSWVTTGTKLTPELMHFLLSTNNRFIFGAFSLDSDGSITFRHSIIGSTMDKNEFKAAIKVVALSADEYDDEIISKFGGKSAVDELREESEKSNQQDPPSKL